MQKEIRFFKKQLPKDKDAIHIWIGKSDLPHDRLISQLIGQNLDIKALPSGKPYFLNSSLYFNLSDTEDWIAIAFSWQVPIGIDIETIRPVEGMDRLISDYFSSKEQAYVKEKDALTRFWKIWNRKEACLKTLGLGLQDNMARWDCLGDGWIFVNNVWVQSLSIKNNLSGAIAFST